MDSLNLNVFLVITDMLLINRTVFHAATSVTRAVGRGLNSSARLRAGAGDSPISLKHVGIFFTKHISYIHVPSGLHILDYTIKLPLQLVNRTFWKPKNTTT